MDGLTDQQLLRLYAEEKSEAAFSELLRRYVDLVYSAALRMVHESHAAKDVTQESFVALAQNAGQLTKHPVLAGWLHQTARNIAANVIRSGTRRSIREQEAASMNEMLASQTEAGWDQIASQLDEALYELSKEDRDALLLRYFQCKSAQEMAATLGVSSEAAQKRVNRAVERLREFLARRGITAGASGLVVVISTNAVQAAPAELAAIVSATAFAGATATTSTIIATAKTIAMTTPQKFVVAALITALAGAGIYQARQISQLRDQNQTLQNQLGMMTAQKLEMEKLQATAPVEVQTNNNIAAATQDIGAEWSSRLLALNTSDWRQAFSTGEELARLRPSNGLAILRTNWNSITNISARQQLIKAFFFAQHERLPAVLELGVLDNAPEVQGWTLNYLKEVALQDFAPNIAGAKDWLSARRDSTLSAAFADALWQAANTLRTSSGDQLRDQLNLLKSAGQLFSKCSDTSAVAGLNQALGEKAVGSDVQAAEWALKAASSIPVGDDWRREIALPLLTSDNPLAVREAAAHALGKSGSDWAIPPLLDALSQSVYSQDRASISSLAQPLAELGSPKAIPTMIALIEAENTSDTIYGIGYFGLSKMTGVAFDEKHDGAWWRQWWEGNKQRFAADIQILKIPQLNAVKKPGAATTQ